MKVEGRIFDIVMGFGFFIAIVYAICTKWSTGSVEVVGTTAITLTGGLCLIVGTYFRLISKRIEQRPEDNPDAEIADGAGEVGFFSAGSYWPIGVAAAATTAAIALALWQIWLLATAIALVLVTVGGLLFEYHTGAAHE
jgi:hypothetical protein